MYPFLYTIHDILDLYTYLFLSTQRQEANVLLQEINTLKRLKHPRPGQRFRKSGIWWEKNYSQNNGEADFGWFSLENSTKTAQTDVTTVSVCWCVFSLFYFLLQQKWHEANYIVMIIPCFRGGWTGIILSRWWIYMILGTFFKSNVVLEKTPIFLLVQIYKYRFNIFCPFAYLLPKLKVSPSDGWEDELLKFSVWWASLLVPSSVCTAWKVNENKPLKCLMCQ